MPDGHSPSDWKPTHSPWLVAVSVLLATFMEVLDTSIANVALPHIAGSLSASVDEATWVLTSYLVSNAVILSSTGWLSSYFGRKRYLAFSVGLFILSSALCGMAQSLPQLIIARILQGIGGGGLQPLSQAILLESFPPQKRGEAMAAYGMGIVVAPILGPILGGWITDNYTWRWIFYINIPIGLAGLILQELFVEDPPYIKEHKAATIDWQGFGMMALGIGLLQVVLDKGQEADWFGADWIGWSVAVAVVSLVSWVIWELTHDEPIVNLRLLKDRNFATATVMVAFLGAVLYGTTAMLPIFMQTMMGYPAFQAGYAMMPRGLGSFFSMLIVGRLIRFVDPRLLAVLGFGGVGGSCWVLSQMNLDVAQSNITTALFLNGFSMGFIFVPLTVLSYATLKQRQIFQATGLYNLLRNIGASVGISAIVAVQDRVAQEHQVDIAAHLTPFSPALHRAFSGLSHMLQGAVGAHASRLTVPIIYGELLQQSSLLAFMDSFRLLAIISLSCLPLLAFFTRPPRSGRQPTAPAH